MSNPSDPPSLNFDFSSLSVSPLSHPSNRPIPTQNSDWASPSPPTTPMNSQENSHEINQSNQALNSVQQRMEQMKAAQENIKRLKEEKKLEEQRKLENNTNNSFPQFHGSFNKPEQPSQVLQSTQTAQLPQELLNSMSNFMNTVDTKLQAMENQLRKLTLDFHQACNKQEQNTDALAKRLNLLKNQLEDTRSSVSSPTTAFSSYPKLSPEAPVHSSPFSPPAAIPSFTQTPPLSTGPTQEEIDAEMAKKLQEQFDNEQKQSAAQTQAAQTHRSSQFTQTPVYQQTPPSYQPIPATQEKEACPVCGISFPVGKELTEHANSHFEQMQPQQRQQAIQQIQQANPKQNDEPGFFAKIFGAKPKQEVRPPVYYSATQPQQHLQQPQQQPQMQQQPQQQSQNRQPVAYYQSPSGQPVYIAPNGAPVYPQMQQQQRF